MRKDKLSRQSLYNFHSLLGILTGLAMILIGFSGSLAVFNDEVEWVFNPEVRVSSEGSLVSIDSIVSTLENSTDDGSSFQLGFPPGDTHTQSIVAEAFAKLDAIETVMFRNYDVMVDQAGNQGGIPMIDRVKFRYDASLVIEKCLEVVDTLFSNAGGGAVFAGSDIQKIFLDVHTSRAHVANNPVSFSRNYGAMQLGVENTDYFV